MTALSEALVAAQRQAIAALSKSYIAGGLDQVEGFTAALDEIGCTDKVEQAQLLASLDTLRQLGAQAPEPTKPDTSQDVATEAQMKFAAKLADERGVILPDYQLTKANASQVIEQLKAGTYNPDEWTVPF